MIERRPFIRMGDIPMAIGGTGLVIARDKSRSNAQIVDGRYHSVHVSRGSLTQSTAGDSPLIAGLCYVKLKVDANGMFNTRAPAVASAFPSPNCQLKWQALMLFMAH